MAYDKELYKFYTFITQTNDLETFITFQTVMNGGENVQKKEKDEEFPKPGCFLVGMMKVDLTH